MPCTITGSIEGDRELMARGNTTALTQLLCGACTLLEANGIDISGIKTEEVPDLMMHQTTLVEWWERHKKIDANKHWEDIYEY